MKRFFSLFLVLALILSACSIFSCTEGGIITSPQEHSYSKGLQYRKVNNGTAYGVFGIGECKDTDIIIPNEYMGLPVVKIIKNAFNGNNQIQSVTVPEGITEIGDSAFLNCRNLVSVTLPESLTTLGAGVFELCLKLESVNIPKNVTKIPEYTFAACESLKDIELHEGITDIGYYAFYLCRSIEKLNVPSNLLGEYIYPFTVAMNNVKEFETFGQSGAFFTLEGNLYAKLDSYGGLWTETIFFSYAMGKDDTSFIVPSNVQIIAHGAFSFRPWSYEKTENTDNGSIVFVDYNQPLTSVTLSEGVTTIDDYAFWYCTNLSNVKLPHSMKYIEAEAFAYCGLLKTIEYNGTIEEWHAIEKPSNWYVYCPIQTIKCTDGQISPNENPETFTEPITVWVPNNDGAKELAEMQIDRFMEDHPKYQAFDITVKEVVPNEAKDKILNGTEGTPDMYYFTAGDMDTLINANALSIIPLNTTSVLKNRNNTNAVNAASRGSNMYAYPADFYASYYMYYDTSIITDPSSLEQIIADIQAYNRENGASKCICFNIGDGWYASSFFHATGCYSNWTTDENGNFISYNDTYNSDNGLVALKGMEKLAKSGILKDSQTVVGDAAVCITGIWNSNLAMEHFGENMGVAILPSFTVDSNDYKLQSMNNYTLLGITPQLNKTKRSFLNELASYLTAKDCQMERYTELGAIPTNRVALMDDSITSNIHISTMIAQSDHSVPQRALPIEWWKHMMLFYSAAAQSTSDDDLKAALEAYQTSIDEIID